MLMIAAVAVTAVICIAGTYILLDGDVQKQTIRVTTSENISIEEMTLFFTEFENNSIAVIQMTPDTTEFTEDHVRSLLNGDVDVVITDVDMTGAEGFDVIKINDVFIVFGSGAQDDIINFFKNWLHFQV